MLRVFVLVPGILLGVMWRDETFNRITPKSFVFDMIFNNYIVLVFILMGRTYDLVGFRFENVYARSKNSVGMLVGFLMVKGICSLILCGVAFRLASDFTEYVPITLGFTVLHMLVSFGQYLKHRCHDDDDDDDNAVGVADSSINRGLLPLRHATPTAPQEPYNRENCYRVFQFRNPYWRLAVVVMLLIGYVISLMPLMPPSIPPPITPSVSPIPAPASAPASAPAPAHHMACPTGSNHLSCSGHGECKSRVTSQDAYCVCKNGWSGVACATKPSSPCYGIDCGHGKCQAVSSSPSPNSPPAGSTTTVLNGGLLAGVIILNLIVIPCSLYLWWVLCVCAILDAVERPKPIYQYSLLAFFIIVPIGIITALIWGSVAWVAGNPINSIVPQGVGATGTQGQGATGPPGRVVSGLSYTCRCNSQWTGANCDNCVSGYWGKDCSSACPGGAAQPCSGFGQCSQGPTGTGKCTCQDGVGGSACNTCPSNHFGSHCTQTCPTGSAGIGADCWEAYLPNYPNCSGYSSAGYTCVGDYCAAMNPGGDYWSCAIKKGANYVVDQATGSCINVGCSGHGTCDAGTPMSTGDCTCSKGWTGNNW